MSSSLMFSKRASLLVALTLPVLSLAARGTTSAENGTAIRTSVNGLNRRCCNEALADDAEALADVPVCLMIGTLPTGSMTNAQWPLDYTLVILSYHQLITQRSLSRRKAQQTRLPSLSATRLVPSASPVCLFALGQTLRHST